MNLDLSLLLSAFQSGYHFLTIILPEDRKERAGKMSGEFSHFYAALAKDLVRLKIGNNNK